MLYKEHKKYDCLCCNFSTKNIALFRKHCDTSKHKKLITKDNKNLDLCQTSNNDVIITTTDYKCKFCNYSTLRASNLSRHLKVCSNANGLSIFKKQVQKSFNSLYF